MALFGRKSARPGDPAKRAPAPGEASGSAAPVAGAAVMSPPSAGRSVHATREGESQMARIGKSIQLEGELRGDEDLEIDGAVAGKVELPSHTLTIAEHGRVTASVTARRVRILGHLAGNVTASESVEVEASGVVEGDIRSPRLMIQEGAVLNGAIDMSAGEIGSRAEPSPDSDDSGTRKAG